MSGIVISIASSWRLHKLAIMLKYKIHIFIKYVVWGFIICRKNWIYLIIKLVYTKSNEASRTKIENKRVKTRG